MRTTLLAAMLFWTLVIAVSCMGCSTRTISNGEWTYKSSRFVMQESFGNLSISTNGTVTLEGYKSDQVQAIEAAVSAAVSAALKR